MKRVKLADYVAWWLAKQGVRQVFAISGGASLHLIHGIAKTAGIDYVCPGHEQAGAFAADGYARASGGLGVAIGTSGPGATNMVTGAAGSFYDSVPVMFITGQVATFRFSGRTGVRQMGFQETDTVNIFRPVTKYAVQITRPEKVRYELEKAAATAMAPRAGPVLIDIPDDIQREMIDVESLRGYGGKEAGENLTPDESSVEKCVSWLEQARRPVLILGWGVRLAGAAEEARTLVKKLKVPVAVTWAVADLLPAENEHLIGTFGTHGTRYGNFAVQNADLVLSVGCRLDTRATGGADKFAREAKKVVVDADEKELGKFDYLDMKVDLPVRADAKKFLSALAIELSGRKLPAYSAWRKKISGWKKKYPVGTPRRRWDKKVNPYAFVKALSKLASENARIVVDTGCTVAWMMQAFEFKEGQRLWHDCNNTAMGWALPAAVGVSLAGGGGEVICVTGDGSLMMNVQELATIIKHKLPVKIFVVDNRGYSMIQQTQDQWLDSQYEASSVEGGLSFPNWEKVGRAFGYATRVIAKNADLDDSISACLGETGPAFCDVKVDSKQRVEPQVKYGRPLEDAEPLLPRDQFMKNMIVVPLEVSREDS